MLVSVASYRSVPIGTHAFNWMLFLRVSRVIFQKAIQTLHDLWKWKRFSHRLESDALSNEHFKREGFPLACSYKQAPSENTGAESCYGSSIQSQTLVMITLDRAHGRITKTSPVKRPLIQGGAHSTDPQPIQRQPIQGPLARQSSYRRGAAKLLLLVCVETQRSGA